MPSFALFPLLEASVFHSVYIQIPPPAEPTQGLHLHLTEDMPDLLPPPGSRLHKLYLPDDIYPLFSFRVIVSESEAPYPLGQSLCLSCPHIVLISW